MHARVNGQGFIRSVVIFFSLPKVAFYQTFLEKTGVSKNPLTLFYLLLYMAHSCQKSNEKVEVLFLQSFGRQVAVYLFAHCMICGLQKLQKISSATPSSLHAFPGRKAKKHSTFTP